MIRYAARTARVHHVYCPDCGARPWHPCEGRHACEGRIHESGGRPELLPTPSLDQFNQKVKLVRHNLVFAGPVLEAVWAWAMTVSGSESSREEAPFGEETSMKASLMVAKFFAEIQEITRLYVEPGGAARYTEGVLVVGFEGVTGNTVYLRVALDVDGVTLWRGYTVLEESGEIEGDCEVSPQAVPADFMGGFGS